MSLSQPPYDDPSEPSPISELARWHQHGHYLAWNGREIFHLEMGDSNHPALLLIHGFPTSSWDFSQVIEVLAAGHRVIACDMLGFGLSDKPLDAEYSILQQADIQVALLAKLGITQVSILAHDYGVSVAQELLARQREGTLSGLQINSVCFMNGGLIPGEHKPRLIQRLLLSPLGGLVSGMLNQQRFNKSFSAVFGPDSQPSDEELQTYWEFIAFNDGHRQGHRLIRYMHERKRFKQRWVGELQQPQVPLRFICGEMDPVSGRHMADAYARISPQADLVRLPQVGHYPQCEAPRDVLAAVIDFLDCHDPEQSDQALRPRINARLRANPRR